MGDIGEHRSAAILIAFALMLVGCGETATDVEPIQRPATLGELTGPWQATPFLLDPALRERVAQTCRRDMEMRPGSVPAVIDARGARIATVRMTGPGPGGCSALEITAGGEVFGAGGGWSGGAPEALAAIGGSDLVVVETSTVEGGNLDGQGWSVTGRMGRNVVSVVAETADHRLVQATVENGWFSVWWPVRLPVQQGFAQPQVVPFIVRAYDAFGQVVDEVHQ